MMPRNNNRGGRNNNPSGRNQYSSDWGVMEMARERPIAAAAAAAGAAAAGLFLWSKRSQISNQLGQLSDQFSDWSQNMGSSGGTGEFDDTAGLTTTGSTGSRRGTTGTRRGMSETGGGNASLGARSGGAGTTGTASGRGRARSSTPV
ncbi:MAG TPA: hypothetical protein VFP57_00520 [Sphingomicrobium sp.]|jgi:hypothetical protein|nr:hypothetical protein [Sphingomicrobium sp.]